MNRSGVNSSDDLLVRTRAALLDAVEALREQRDSVVVIGAQAVYLRTGRLQVALAESTKDADLGLDPRGLSDDGAYRRHGVGAGGRGRGTGLLALDLGVAVGSVGLLPSCCAGPL